MLWCRWCVGTNYVATRGAVLEGSRIMVYLAFVMSDACIVLCSSPYDYGKKKTYILARVIIAD